MDHSGRLLINIDGDGKSYFLWNGTESYYKKLRLAYRDIKEDKINDYSYFSFFILCSATLEYSLNYLISDYALNTFGPEECKTFIGGYTSLNMRSKFVMLPSILSNGKLVFNKKTKTFKKLNELVSVRNKIMHGKEELNEFELPNLLKSKEEEIEFQLVSKPNPIDELDKRKCLEYGNALGEYKKYIIESWFNHDLKENLLLLKNEVKLNQ